MKTRNLPKPTSSISEVLLRLITKKETSIKDFYWLSGFRTRISDLKLKYGLILDSKIHKFKNKHGNAAKYTIHVLPEDQRKKAIDVYKHIVKSE